MSHFPLQPAHRSWPLRLTLWAGLAVFAAIGLPLTFIGLLAISEAFGQGMLCFGLVCLASFAGGLARELAERAPAPLPCLVSLEGESALFLPRAAAPSRISSLALTAYALIAALGALFTTLTQAWGWSVALALLAAYLLYVAMPWTRSAAGGMWFTPRRVVAEHDGRRWEAPWEAITGVVAQQPMPVLVRPDRMPHVRRTGPRGRAWNPARTDGVIAVDTRFLAGGTLLASYVITQAITDPASRSVLGTAQSLPAHR